MAPRKDAKANDVLRTAQVHVDTPDPIRVLIEQLGTEPFELVCLFVSPEADFRRLMQLAIGKFGDSDLLACTTAGELGIGGYEDGQIIAVAFPRKSFSVTTRVLEDLSNLNEKAVVDELIKARMNQIRNAHDKDHEFALMLIDGLSMKEERLTSLLASGLGPVPLFGGSAGDGTRFNQTLLARNGTVYEDAALIALVRSAGPVKVFSLDHLEPTDVRMVVTSADPELRVVREINAEPAAQEYARLLGKDPNQLGPFTFAAHPVVVRVGDTHHVRAIQQVNSDGDLVFFSAINEGMVLTLADHHDIAAHLDTALDELGRIGKPSAILGCDCLFRRIAADQTQKTREISRILRSHKVFGFSTYGEQIGALHVNQTLTGVAFYHADDTVETP